MLNPFRGSMAAANDAGGGGAGQRSVPRRRAQTTPNALTLASRAAVQVTTGAVPPFAGSPRRASVASDPWGDLAATPRVDPPAHGSAGPHQQSSPRQLAMPIASALRCVFQRSSPHFLKCCVCFTPLSLASATIHWLIRTNLGLLLWRLDLTGLTRPPCGFRRTLSQVSANIITHFGDLEKPSQGAIPPAIVALNAFHRNVRAA